MWMRSVDIITQPGFQSCLNGKDFYFHDLLPFVCPVILLNALSATSQPIV